jgi:hypothetical protein
MALTVSQLFTPVQLAGAAAVLFTMTVGTLKNGRVRLTNTSAGTRQVTLYADVAATGSSAANCCLNNFSIAANTYQDIDLPTLKAGDTLRGFADTANNITMHELGGTIYS